MKSKKTYNFTFKQFGINHDRSSMKVGTDAIILGAYANTHACKNILEVGTGSGIIMLALVQRSSAKITAIDIDPSSVIQARENAASSKWKSSIQIEETSLQEFSNQTEEKFDLIVSNPPFFENSLKAPKLSRNNARHTDTLSHEDLITHTSRLMHESSMFSFIIPVENSLKFKELAKESDLFLNDILEIRPSVTKPVNRVVLTFSKTELIQKRKELIIRNDDNSYHESFINLTKEYYLMF